LLDRFTKPRRHGLLAMDPLGLKSLGDMADEPTSQNLRKIGLDQTRIRGNQLRREIGKKVIDVPMPRQVAHDRVKSAETLSEDRLIASSSRDGSSSRRLGALDQRFGVDLDRVFPHRIRNLVRGCDLD
jgi:hypothetical protein